MHTNLSVQRFFVVSFVLLLSGCSLWSDQTPDTRLSVQLNDGAPPTIRSAWLQHQVNAMDAAALGGQRSGLSLKLSYQLTLVPRKT